MGCSTSAKATWRSPEQIDKNDPDSWKGYNISNAAKVDEDPRA
jgi:hypothetical protein